MIRIEKTRKFKGYRVIEHIKISDTEFAIGYCRMEDYPYATFICRKDKGYIDKIPFLTLEEAQLNIVERMNKEINFYRPFRNLVKQDGTKVVGGKIYV